MPWIGLAVVCLGLIIVSFYNQKVGFSLLGVIAVIVVGLYFYESNEVSNSSFPVAPENLELTSMSTEISYGDSWDYSGRISNSSNKTVTDLQIRVQLYDCPVQSTSITDDCVVIGEDIDYVSVNVPPRQARDFTDNVSFKNAKPQGKDFWEFELTGVEVSE